MARRAAARARLRVPARLAGVERSELVPAGRHERGDSRARRSCRRRPHRDRELTPLFADVAVRMAEQAGRGPVSGEPPRPAEEGRALRRRARPTAALQLPHPDHQLLHLDLQLLRLLAEPRAQARRAHGRRARTSGRRASRPRHVPTSIEGGEPFVRADIFDVVRVLSKHHITSIFTSGWFMMADTRPPSLGRRPHARERVH